MPSSTRTVTVTVPLNNSTEVMVTDRDSLAIPSLPIGVQLQQTQTTESPIASALGRSANDTLATDSLVPVPVRVTVPVPEPGSDLPVETVIAKHKIRHLIVYNNKVPMIPGDPIRLLNPNRGSGWHVLTSIPSSHRGAQVQSACSVCQVTNTEKMYFNTKLPYFYVLSYKQIVF